MSHLIEGPGHSRHFAGMPNDFRSSGKVTASRSTRDALHVDLRGAAKRARDEAVVEGISTVWPSIATIRSEDFRPARAAGSRWGRCLRHRAPRHPEVPALRAWRSFGVFVPDEYDARHPPNPVPFGCGEFASVGTRSRWSHRIFVRFFKASGRIHPAGGGDYIKFTTAALGLAGALATSQVRRVAVIRRSRS